MDWDSVFATRAGRMKASEIRELLKLLDQPEIISFAGGIPDPALFPAEEFRDAFSSVLSGADAGKALQYSTSEGFAPLREWIADRMGGSGVPCGIGNILITSGSQQALDYIGKLFLSPGDTALMTWPTYLGALQAFNAYEPNYDRLSMRGNRSAEDHAATAAAAGGQVKFAYLSCEFANPTGETLSRADRIRMLDLAAELDIPIIEDGAYQSLRYDGEAIPPILALDIERCGGIENSRTIYCGSFSKTLSPGLRLGWVCAAKPVIAKLVLGKQAADLHSPTINQMALHRVAECVFDSEVEKLRTVYARRRDRMLEALERTMPDGVTWTRPEGGMFIWITLPDGVDATALLARSLRDGKVAFVPGRAFHADGSGENTMRVNFTNADEARIDEGIARLARCVKAALA
jgi:DNA-binding transcriptional MocR family regulator